MFDFKKVKKMFELHIANKNYSSWSLRTWILMKQLEIPFYERKHLFSGKNTKEEFHKFSPSSTVPCLVDGNTTVWDSLAIAEYLGESFPIWPKDKKARAFGRSAAAEMHASFSNLRRQCPMSCGIRVKMAVVNELLTADLKRMDELWQQGIGQFGGPFLVGQSFSAADAFFCPVAFRIQTYGLTMSDSAMEYAFRLLDLPFMQRWYDDALKEQSRDESDDRAALLHKTLVADYRAKA